MHEPRHDALPPCASRIAPIAAGIRLPDRLRRFNLIPLPCCLVHDSFLRLWEPSDFRPGHGKQVHLHKHACRANWSRNSYISANQRCAAYPLFPLRSLRFPGQPLAIQLPSVQMIQRSSAFEAQRAMEHDTSELGQPWAFQLRCRRSCAFCCRLSSLLPLR